MPKRLDARYHNTVDSKFRSENSIHRSVGLLLASRLKDRATHELFIAQSTGLLFFKQLWIKFDCEGEVKVTPTPPHLEPERVENAIVTYQTSKV